MAAVDEMKQFATPRQWEILQAIHKCNGSYREAGRLLDIDQSNVTRAMQRLRATAARRGYAPEYDLTKPVPIEFHAAGVSTLYDDEGNIKLQWVKSAADKQRVEAVNKEAMDAFCEELPRAKPAKAPTRELQDLLNLYVITDYHLGMYAWHEETGEDWNLQIAEELLTNWFLTAVALAPDTEECIFYQGGDFAHWDGMDAVTPANKHILDADTRFAKLVRVAIRALRNVIDALLRKHKKVRVIMAEGNHDPASSVWLREWFAAWLENEPRVEVDQSPDPYYCYEFGLTSLFFHHGHKRGVKTVDPVFVSKFREVFGRTKYSYGHMGHQHHKHVLESNLMIVEQHPTLAAKDSYNAREGYSSHRATNVITYSKEHGEVGRITLTPEMCNVEQGTGKGKAKGGAQPTRTPNKRNRKS